MSSCDTCKASIPESDLESGAAISVLGKTYCGVCKNRAVKDISLDDLVADVSPAPGSLPKSPKAPEAPKPARPAVPFEQLPTMIEAVKKPKPPPATAPEDLPTVVRPPAAPPVTRRKVVIRSAGSKGPFIILGGLGIAAAILVFVLVKVTQDRKPPGPGPGPGPSNGAEAAGKDPAVAKEEAGQRAYNDAMLVSSRNDAGFEEILKAIDRAKPACEGTKWLAKLEELRGRKLKEKEMLEAQVQLGRLVEELKAAVAEDRDYRRYSELMPKFQAAREKAAKAAPTAQAAVLQVQTEYTTGYEKAAAPHLEEIQEAAKQLASEGRFDLALKWIDKFPLHLRQSGAWKTLDRLRIDLEERKRGSK